MASMNISSTHDSGKTAPESGYTTTHPPPQPNFIVADVALRLLLFATTLSALIIMVSSKQTEQVPTLLPPPFPATVYRAAKFNHSPAFIYMVVALSVTCFYSVVTIIFSGLVASSASFSKLITMPYSTTAGWRPAPSTMMLFNLILFDVLMAGVMASATGATGGVAYIGLKGNSHVRWNKICNIYDKFCRYVGATAGISLASSIILVALVVLSSYTLYRRSR